MSGSLPKKTPTGQTPPNPAKDSRSIIPAPQRERIMQLHVLGKSIREIARKEMRDRATVANIVHGDDMREFVFNLRQRLYALGDHALETVKHGLVVGRDAHLAYRLLADIGAVPSPSEREPIRANGEVVKEEDLNPFEKEVAGDSQGTERRILIGLARMMQERAKFYGYEEATPEELRHGRVMAAVIEELTDGQSSTLSCADQHRLSVQVENALRGLKEAEEKHKEDEAKERTAKASLRLNGVPGCSYRPRLRLRPDDAGDGAAGQPRSGTPCGGSPSSQGGK